MRSFSVIENAWLSCENGKITRFGNMDTCPNVDVEVVETGEKSIEIDFGNCPECKLPLKFSSCECSFPHNPEKAWIYGENFLNQIT